MPKSQKSQSNLDKWKPSQDSYPRISGLTTELQQSQLWGWLSTGKQINWTEQKVQKQAKRSQIIYDKGINVIKQEKEKTF